MSASVLVCECERELVHAYVYVCVWEIYFVWLFFICSVGSSMRSEWYCEIVFASGHSFCFFFLFLDGLRFAKFSMLATLHKMYDSLVAIQI